VRSKFFKGICVLALIALLPSQAAATEPFAKVGTYALQFLKIGVSARATGIGGAFTAICNDATSTYWNPAGMVDVTRTTVSVNHTWWPADISLDYATAVFTLPFVPGSFGVSARALTLDPQVERTIFLGVSYAKFFTDKFSSGGTVHFIHSGLDDKSVNTFSVDFGLVYRIGLMGMRLGMMIQSLGAKVDYDDRASKMPTIFKIGMAATPYQQVVNSLQGLFEFSHPSDNQERVNVGTEYSFNQFFFLRGGYNFNADSQGLAAGIGLKIDTSQTSDLIFDYSWVDLDFLGDTHRISLGFSY
jgi:hypothetical protein